MPLGSNLEHSSFYIGQIRVVIMSTKIILVKVGIYSLKEDKMEQDKHDFRRGKVQSDELISRMLKLFSFSTFCLFDHFYLVTKEFIL